MKKDKTLQNTDQLFEKVAELIEQSRKYVKKAIDTAMVYTYYAVGYYIVEDEQGGAAHARYGAKTLEMLSVQLTDRFGRGWSVETLKKARQFYTVYSPRVAGDKPLHRRIGDSVHGVDRMDKLNSVYSVDQIPIPSFSNVLSWNHYQILMRSKSEEERRFYEIECEEQQWSVRELQRQRNSSLYERLALSRNKAEVLRLSREGQVIEKASDVIKDPVALEFLGMRPETTSSETKLETAIINKLQQFLMEMGKGFLLEARQKRFTFDEDHYFADLVLYNRLLQCYCIIDLKVHKLTHDDLGQMQMYVNYYDRYVRKEWEKPTIGILICKEKKNALVELTLPKDANIFATEYTLYLPDKKMLQAKLKTWIKEEEERVRTKDPD